MSSKPSLSSLDKCLSLSIDGSEGRVFPSLGISSKVHAADREISRLSRLSINTEPLVPKDAPASRKRKERSINQLENQDFQAVRDVIQSASFESPLNSPRNRSKEPIDERRSNSDENLSNGLPIKRRRCSPFKRSSLSPFSLDGSSND